MPRPELDELRAALLRDLGVDLTPEQGDVAFERHQLLAIRFTRAARLNRRSADGEGEGWSRYFREHFPRGEQYASLLWTEWRCQLLKEESPGVGVAISHGQPLLHWKQTSHGLYLNLDSLVADYEQSVETFVAMLDTDKKRRRVALDRFRSLQQWSVQTVIVPATVPMTLPGPVGYVASAASVSTSVSKVSSEPRERSDDVDG